SFLSAGQLAITRKDLKGLVRRKEMLRFLALPVVFLATSLFGISSAGSSSGGASIVFSGFSYFGIFIVGFSTFFLALSSVGAEGKSIVNLYQLPLTVRDFVVGKAITPIVFGSVFGVIFFSIVDVLFPPLEPALTLILPVLAIACATELAFVGLYVGARFPNFSEEPSSCGGC
ncbi:MAG: hypothetical protein M1368_02330, partial [Thaumarchaeota archaeon]|nr:hypothetical protein [Nitrososphaerota archaeon]